MGNQSIVLLIVAAVAVISLFSTPNDVFADHISTHTNIVIPTGSHTPTCSSTPDLCYNPDDVTVNQFDTITWNNTSGNPQHTATSGSEGFQTGVFDTGILNGGISSDPISMDVVGTFVYYCQLHPWQVGTVTVVGAVNPVSIPLGADDLNCAMSIDACYDPSSLVVVPFLHLHFQ